MTESIPKPHPLAEVVVSADESLVAESAESADRLRVLLDLGAAICGRTEVGELLAEVPGAIHRLIGAQRCFVATLAGPGRLQPRVCHGIELSDDPATWPVSHTIVRRVMEEGVAILSPDAQQDRQLSKQASIVRHQIRSVMCVPLGRPKSSCIGILYADSRLQPGAFTKEDLKFATALSHFIFLGLRSAGEIEKARAARDISEERAAQLQRELLADHKIVGSSAGLLQAYDSLKRAAEKDVPVLLSGESGSGKELFARAVHSLSPRRSLPFVAVSIAAINPNLVESELFGHEKGSFTGAVSRKIGTFELAHGGTLFLDEVAEIPLHVQAKLLRVLESREFERVGGRQKIPAHFRIVCASHRDLAMMVKDGTFREDLYYRLVGVNIRLPALRERIEDIPELARHILRRLKSDKRFSPAALRQLQLYDWPGNVRQLVRVVEAVDALCPCAEVQPDDLPPPLNPAKARTGDASADAFPTLDAVLSSAEREHIRRALALTAGNKERARELLGISKDTFWKRLKDYAML